MAHTIDLSAAPREVQGKKVRHLRRTGLVPGNVYGHGVTSTSIQVEAKTLQDLLRHTTPTTMVNLKVGSGRPRRVFVRNVQWGLLRREPIHVDFFAVRMDEKMRASVPLIFRGESSAARNSDLMLFHPVDQVQVEGLPGDLPEALEVDLSGLAEADQAIYARDLNLPESVTLVDDPEELIAKVQLVKAAIEPSVPEEKPEAEVLAEEAEAAQSGPTVPTEEAEQTPEQER